MRFFKKRKDSVANQPALSKSLEAYSHAFQQFWSHFIEQPMGLMRGEVNTSFLQALHGEERGIVLSYFRGTLNETNKQFYIIEALGELKDMASVPGLEELLKNQNEIGWKVHIARALYKIKHDKQYFLILLELLASEDSEKISFYQQHLKELKNIAAMRFIVTLLTESSEMESKDVLALLNWLKVGIHFSANEKMPFGKGHFINEVGNDDFLNSLIKLIP